MEAENTLRYLSRLLVFSCCLQTRIESDPQNTTRIQAEVTNANKQIPNTFQVMTENIISILDRCILGKFHKIMLNRIHYPA